MKAAVIQLKAGADKPRNIARALGLVERAAKAGAELILLPEIFSFRGRIHDLAHLRTVAETVPGESTRPFMTLCRQARVDLLAGSVFEEIRRDPKVYNTSVWIGKDGRIKELYRKQNLFRAVVGQKRIDESLIFKAGNQTVTRRVNGFNCGVSICYDLRFPQVYAGMKADVICVPSSFTFHTGKAHWEPLLRARAIENKSYVLAPNQFGTDNRGIRNYGNSMIVDPWGRVKARARTDGTAVLYAQIERKVISEVRRSLRDGKETMNY